MYHLKLALTNKQNSLVNSNSKKLKLNEIKLIKDDKTEFAKLSEK